MNLDKLKESARKFEQNSQWRQAIDVYKKALREFEESGEGVPDPSLYNRIGDLEMKNGDSAAAVRAYEQASDLYTEQGFFNNAIALCGKILRLNPGRTSTYLRLAQLHARKNFVGEAKKNLVEYIDRMDALNHREEGFGAVRTFADQFSGNPDIREMLVELLRASSRDQEAREQLEKLAQELEARGDSSGARRTRERIAAIDVSGPVTTTRASESPGSDLVFIDVGLTETDPTIGSATVDGLTIDRADLEADVWRRDTSAVDGLDVIERVDIGNPMESPDVLVGAGDESLLPVDATDPLDIDSFPTVDLEERIVLQDDDSSGVPLVRSLEDAPYALTGQEIDIGPVDPSAPAGENDLVFLPVDTDEETGRDLEEALENPAVLARDRSSILLEIGDRAGGVAALEEALGLFEGSARLVEALRVADELIRLDPDSIYRHQKRVELAYRSGNRDEMLQSYLGLADALVRSGGLEHAISVYRRVLEHDPENAQARSALAVLVPPEPRPPETPEAAPGSGFVDLGSLILDEPQVRDTRIRVDQAAPIEDEDQAFHEALVQFKRGIEENIDAEDFQAHYDLGIAFKEMGLLDEAIAQFQKALRAPEGRLKTSEQLGIAFYDKGRFAISEAVLRRATDSLAGGDEEKIGLIYWLGRALEAQRRYEEAVRNYERVLAVDIRFLDVGDRMHRLTSGPQ